MRSRVERFTPYSVESADLARILRVKPAHLGRRLLQVGGILRSANPQFRALNSNRARRNRKSSSLTFGDNITLSPRLARNLGASTARCVVERERRDIQSNEVSVIKHCTVSFTALSILALSISSVLYSVDALGQQSAASYAQPSNKPQHVFIIVLENQGFETTFGKKSPAPYLSRELASKGLLLTQYYGIGHF